MSYTNINQPPDLLDNSDITDDQPDVTVQPDVSTGSHPQTAQPQQSQQPQPSQSSSNFFATFVNPQTYIDPLLKDNDIQVKERQFTGGNTLDESVLVTLNRDLSTIADKCLSILWPLRLSQKLKSLRHISGMSGNSGDEEAAQGQGGADYSKEAIKKILDWDLWGPLVINLGFSLILTYLQTSTLADNDSSNSSEIFSGAFTLIWGALAVLSINVQLLTPVKQQKQSGGTTAGVIGLSFFQCISILSYTLFPIVIGALVCIFVKMKLIRMIVTLVMLLWSLLCTWLILAIVNNCKTPAVTSQSFYSAVAETDNGSDGDKRIFLMVYPVVLVYGLFSWLCVIV